jgi:hypothetical protein
MMVGKSLAPLFSNKTFTGPLEPAFLCRSGKKLIRSSEVGYPLISAQRIKTIKYRQSNKAWLPQLFCPFIQEIVSRGKYTKRKQQLSTYMHPMSMHPISPIIL